MRGASRREACVRRRGRRRSGSNRRSNGLWSEQVRTGAPSGAGGMVGYDERRTTGSVPWVRTSGRPSFFLCRGAGRARNESAAVRSACGGVWRSAAGSGRGGRRRARCASGPGALTGGGRLLGRCFGRGARPMRWPGVAGQRGRGGVQSGILPGPEGPEGLEGPGVVLSCNLPGQAMQRIPPVYYLCR